MTPGAQLGPYKIETLLGAGAMGEVFRAKDTRLHRTVAIKVLPRDKTTDLERKQRFMQEARAASALNHPNIVTLHDIASDSGTDFLVIGTPIQVTHGGGFRGDWSPDGSRIAYDKQLLQGSVRENDYRASLEIAEASTGKVLTKVSEDDLASPIWSPDGKRVSATRGNSVWLIDPESGEARLAVQFPRNLVAMFRAGWTPDGKSVIVNLRNRVSHIVLMENFWTQ